MAMPNPSRESTGSPRVSVGFPASVQARLEELSAKHDRSVPYIVRKAVAIYLSQADSEQLALDLGDGSER